jgi:peptidoglycan/LPS O-acetylase OafA/YrhL
VNWWSAAVQWLGTLEFNVSTLAALLTGLSATQDKRLVWSPDFYGSALFLASSVLALVALGIAVSTRRDWGIGWLNMLGSIMFGVAAVAAYVLPTTGEPANIEWVNLGTALGGVCFFAASVWMGRPVPRRAEAPGAA